MLETHGLGAAVWKIHVIEVLFHRLENNVVEQFGVNAAQKKSKEDRGHVPVKSVDVDNSGRLCTKPH